MRIASTGSQRGFGLFGPRSALMLAIDLGEWPALSGRKPDAGELRAMWAELLAFAGEVALFDADPPRPRWGALGDPRIDLLAAIATALMRRYEPREPRVALLSSSAARVRVSILCDEHAIALLAWRHACACLAHLSRIEVGAPSTATMQRRRELADEHQRLRVVARRLALNQLTMALVREAWRRGIPWYRLGSGTEFVQFGQGCRARHAHETVPDTTSSLAARIAHDKALTNALLARMGLPTAGSRLCDSEDDAAHAARAIGYPVVVKPRDGSKGRDVFVGLTDEPQVRDSWRRVSEGGASGVLVERHVRGDDHRLLVIGGRLVAAARRVPAFVVGDGRSSVRELVARLNRDPRRGRSYERLMEKVDLDHEAQLQLREAGLSVDEIPQVGRRVTLRGTANISRGGHADDVTDAIHPDNRELAERAAEAVGLDVTGIDFLSPDIARSWRENDAAVLEVNSSPGLRPHWIADETRDVAGPLFERMFPPGAPARIPTVAVAGSSGATITCRMIAAVLEAAGHRTGLSCSQGIFVGDEQLESGDRAAGGPAQQLLSDPGVEAAVFELARAGLLADGMVVEDCEVGVVLDVRAQHLAGRDVGTPEQLARVYGLVAEAATAAVVLDADDRHCAAVAARVRAPRLIWVSRDAGAPPLARHRAAGGETVALERDGAAGVLHLAKGGRTVARLDLASMAATPHGAASIRVENALFAAASAWALGVPPESIEEGLRAFAARIDRLGHPG